LKLCDKDEEDEDEQKMMKIKRKKKMKKIGYYIKKNMGIMKSI